MKKSIDLLGQKFTRLLVISLYGKNKYNRPIWLCKCDCGKDVVVEANLLRRNHTRSCGCMQKELARKQMTTHGKSRIGISEYRIWAQMRSRCRDTKHRAYRNYGGRGITVCERWANSFENFFADMGVRPSSKHSVERRDNDKNYEPSNCYWATKSEQERNKRTNRWLEYNGERKILADWAIYFGVHESSILGQLKKKTFEQVVEYYKNKSAA